MQAGVTSGASQYFYHFQTISFKDVFQTHDKKVYAYQLVEASMMNESCIDIKLVPIIETHFTNW